MKTRSILAAVVVSVGTAFAAPAASAEPIVRQATGANAAAIQGAVDQFRADLGGGTTAGMNGSFGGVRREINWDGVPDDLAGDSLFPGGFFNANSPRGVVFATPGTGFLVSADDDDGGDVRFSNFNDDFETAFATFSPQRLFTPIESPITETLFRVPGTDAQATTNGFGVVFTDVDMAGSARLQLIGPDGEDLGDFPAPATPGDGSLSFVGVSFNAGERVARVKITSGTGNAIDIREDQMVSEDVTQGGPADLVVMDDFIYGEPKPLAPDTADVTPPEVELEGAPEKLRIDRLLRGLEVEVTTSEEATLDLSLSATPRRVELAGKPRLILAEKSLGLASGTRSVKLKPQRKLLRRAGAFRAELRLVAIDGAGNRQPVKRSIRVRP